MKRDDQSPDELFTVESVEAGVQEIRDGKWVDGKLLFFVLDMRDKCGIDSEDLVRDEARYSCPGNPLSVTMKIAPDGVVLTTRVPADPETVAAAIRRFLSAGP